MEANPIKAVVITLMIGLATSTPSFAIPDSSVVMRVARTYGIDSFPKIAKLKFTFNVTYNGKKTERSWMWDVRGDQVTLTTAGDPEPLTYKRALVRMDVADRIHKADAQFINDQYWLLFPFHLVWDSMSSMQTIKNEMMPLGGGAATRITVSYPSSGGYTPGDGFDLYVGTDNRVAQWVYHRANSETPTRVAFWRGYAKVGPLTLSLDRPGSDDGFRVWFTDVAVMLSGQSDWIGPKELSVH